MTLHRNAARQAMPLLASSARIDWPTPATSSPVLSARLCAPCPHTSSALRSAPRRYSTGLIGADHRDRPDRIAPTPHRFDMPRPDRATHRGSCRHASAVHRHSSRRCATSLVSSSRCLDPPAQIDKPRLAASPLVVPSQRSSTGRLAPGRCSTRPVATRQRDTAPQKGGIRLLTPKPHLAIRSDHPAPRCSTPVATDRHT